MGYRYIETITHWGQKRVQWKSTGHNGDHLTREQKRQTALARAQPPKPKYLGRAGTQ